MKVLRSLLVSVVVFVVFLVIWVSVLDWIGDQGLTGGFALLYFVVLYSPLLFLLGGIWVVTSEVTDGLLRHLRGGPQHHYHDNRQLHVHQYEYAQQRWLPSRKSE